jgi:hypothetical protein
LKAQGHASAALNAWLTDFDSGNALQATTKRSFPVMIDLKRK